MQYYAGVNDITAIVLQRLSVISRAYVQVSVLIGSTIFRIGYCFVEERESNQGRSWENALHSCSTFVIRWKSWNRAILSFELRSSNISIRREKKKKKEKEKIKKLCRGNEHVRTRYINVPDHIPDTRTDTKSRRWIPRGKFNRLDTRHAILINHYHKTSVKLWLC